MAWTAMSRSTSASSSPWKSNWRNKASTLRHLSAGRACSKEPASTDTREQISVRACRHQIPGQDPMHLTLQPGPLPHQMRQPRNEPPPHSSLVISNPCLGQRVRSQQLSENTRVDLIGLHLRLGDRRAVRCRLQRDLVIRLEHLSPRPQVFRLDPDLSLITAQAVLNNRDLRE